MPFIGAQGRGNPLKAYYNTACNPPIRQISYHMTAVCQRSGIRSKLHSAEFEHASAWHITCAYAASKGGALF